LCLSSIDDNINVDDLRVAVPCRLIYVFGTTFSRYSVRTLHTFAIVESERRDRERSQEEPKSRPTILSSIDALIWAE
jgi:hypothetical protein